jgi:hypothetical protein
MHSASYLGFAQEILMKYCINMRRREDAQDPRRVWIDLRLRWRTVSCMIWGLWVMFLLGETNNSGRRIISGNDWTEQWQMMNGGVGSHCSMYEMVIRSIRIIVQ